MDGQTPKPLVGLVVGDPAGIGPELAARLAADSSVADAVRLLIIGDRRIFDRGAEIAGTRLVAAQIHEDELPHVPPGQHRFLDVRSVDPATVVTGRTGEPGGASALANFRKALDLGEAATMVDILHFFAGLAGELKEQTVPSAQGVFQYSRRESMGVVGAIIPWNAPLMQTASKIGPALVAGNTVVLKPAEQAPLAVLRVFEILQEVLPPGVANCVTGIGEETGKLLVEHPLVRKVTFTGSTSTGAEILRAAGSKIMPVTAELGGKNPIIVMPDADIGRAADGILRGLRLQRQGQSCSAGTRIYIHDDIYQQVIQRVIDVIPTFRIGDPLDDATQVGSIISKEQLARVERYVALARSTAGGKVLTGGARPSIAGLENGYFYSTTLIEGLPRESDVCRDEIFGPVATVSRWNDFDEVLGEASNTNYGLAAVIWTQNLARALEFVDRIEAGFVQVNQFSVAEANIEYGGAKMSGMGRELSLESMIQHFTWSKTVLMNGNGAEA